MQCIKDSIKNINIVIGCDIGCTYCYARMNNARFHTTDDFNIPIFFENKLKMLDNKKHTAYLLTGQSDLSGWKQEWLDKVYEKMKENQDTQYIFLTKRPDKIKLTDTPDNGWFGVTVTSSKEKEKIDILRKNIKAKHYHITFEPLFDDVGKLDLTDISWIVIGTETGNRKNKSYTKREWLYNIYNQAKEKNIPVFMKEDLLGIIEENEFIQEFPVEFGE